MPLENLQRAQLPLRLHPSARGAHSLGDIEPLTDVACGELGIANQPSPRRIAGVRAAAGLEVGVLARELEHAVEGLLGLVQPTHPREGVASGHEEPQERAEADDPRPESQIPEEVARERSQ